MSTPESHSRPAPSPAPSNTPTPAVGSEYGSAPNTETRVDERASRALRDAAASLYSIVLNMLVLVALMAFVALLIAVPAGITIVDLTRQAVAGATLVAAALGFYFGRRGKMRLGLALAFIAIHTSIVAHAVISGLGIHAYLLTMSSLLISGSYLLLDRRSGHFATAIGMSTLAILFGVEAAGIAFAETSWVIPARNVFAVYVLLYAISALLGARYAVFFATLVNEVNHRADELRDMILSLPAGCAIVRDGRIWLANDLYKTHTGIPLTRQLEGIHLLDLSASEGQREKVERRLREADSLAPGEYLRPMEYMIPDGERMRTVRAETRKVRINDTDAFLTLTQDVTERNAMLEALDRERLRAITAGQAKATFLATMSHEIRTPMNAVMGLTDLLRRGDVAPDKQSEYLDMIADSSNALLGILNDVLDMAQIDSGRLSVRQEPVDVRALCLNVSQTYEKLAHERGLAFDCDIANDVPQQIMADTMRLRQVLVNLLSNAIKFTRAGYVALRAHRGDQYLEIVVEDTGIGISAEDQTQLFTPFVQADSASTREFGGTGLGLALSRELVLAMQGTIHVKSTLGKGSRFMVRLPLVLDDAREDAPAAPIDIAPPSIHVSAAPPSSQSSQDVSLENGDVLVVEDNELNALVISAQLDRIKVAHRVVTDTRAAIEACRAQPPSLVLLDINLPGMDGFECAKVMRQLPHMANVPIVACTAWVIDANDPRCVAAGIGHVLHKPVTHERLVHALQTRGHASNVSQ